MPSCRMEHVRCCRAAESVGEYTLVSKDTVEMVTTISADNESNQTNRSLRLYRGCTNMTNTK